MNRPPSTTIDISCATFAMPATIRTSGGVTPSSTYKRLMSAEPFLEEHGGARPDDHRDEARRCGRPLRHRLVAIVLSRKDVMHDQRDFPILFNVFIEAPIVHVEPPLELFGQAID